MVFFHNEPCSCGHKVLAVLVARPSVTDATFLGNPELALALGLGLNGESVHPEYLQMLAYHPVATVDPQHRSVKMVEGFIDLIVNGYDLPPGTKVAGVTREEPAWETPLAGLSHVVEGIARSQQPYSSKDRQIVQLVVSKCTNVLGAIAKDYSEITYPGWDGDYRRSIIAHFLLVVIEVFRVAASIVRDEASLKVIMWCYVYTERPHRTVICQAVARLFLHTCKFKLPEDRWYRAAQTVGVDTFLAYIACWLTDETMPARKMALEIDTCSGFLMAPDPLGEAVRAAKTWRHIVDALHRQRKASWNTAASLEVFRAGFAFITEQFQEQGADVGLEQVQAGTIDLASWAVTQALLTKDITDHDLESLPYWAYFRAIFRHSVGPSLGLPGQPARSVSSPEYAAARRTAMNKVYLPTLTVLRQRRVRIGVQPARFWFDVANLCDVPVDATADLGEPSGPSTLDNFDVCRNPRCAHRGKDEVMKLMRCARCRRAKYCSVECQKGHWKEHKPECAAAAT